jgi:hypothetical protein
MTHLNNLLRNKLVLQKNYHLQESAIDSWPFWMLEENIKIVKMVKCDKCQKSMTPKSLKYSHKCGEEKTIIKNL